MAIVTAVAILSIGIQHEVNPFDEGYVLYGAQRVLEGAVPYRDFWVVYAPGQFYVVAALFALFGPSVMVMRAYDVLVRLALVVLSYRVARRLGGRAAGIAAGVTALLLLAAAQFFGYPMFPALALCLLSLDLWQRSQAGTDGPGRVAAGAAAGAALLFRQDVGLYCVACTAATAILEARRSPAVGRATAAALARYATGVALVVVPVVAGLLAARVPVAELWNDLVVFPSTVLTPYRRLPLPSGDAQLDVVRLMGATGAAFAIALALGVFRRPCSDLLLPSTLGAVLLRQALIRLDAIHLLPATLLGALLVPVLVARTSRTTTLGAAALALGFLVLAGDLVLVDPIRQLEPAVRAGPRPGSSLPRAWGVAASAAQEAAVSYVRTHTATGEPIFVGHARHDRLVANDIAFYFLADRPVASRYFDLCPGMVTTRPVQEEIVAALERSSVHYIVIRSEFGGGIEPNESSRSSGVHVLDDYLRRTFRIVARYGDYTICRLRQVRRGAVDRGRVWRRWNASECALWRRLARGPNPQSRRA